MTTYLITGGAGFIGSNLARKLVETGNTVFVLDDLSTGFERNVPAGATLLRADIRDARMLERLPLPAKLDVVYHFAAQSSGEASFDDPSRDIDINYHGTWNILEMARRHKATRFMYASSMSVYGEAPSDHSRLSEEYPCKPVSYYGCNKLASEHLIRLHAAREGIHATLLRFFSVYGPGQNLHNMKQGIVSIYLAYAMQNQPIWVKGALDRFRDLTFVGDVVEACRRSEVNPATHGGVFNIGTGVPTTVEQMVKAILQAFGRTDFQKWVRVEGNTPGDIKGCTADISRLEAALGWRPTMTIEQGIRLMKQWVDETRDWWKTDE